MTKLRVLNFDGIDDCIDIPPMGIDSLGAFTIETWIKVGELSGIRSIRNENTSTSGNVHYFFYNKSLIFCINGNTPDHIAFDYRFKTGTWYHLALIYDKTIKKVQLFVDGEFVEEQDFQVAISARFGQASIGSWNAGRFFKGSICEMRIWDHVRKIDKIVSYKNIRLTGKEKGLIGYWTLMDGEGQGAKDFTRYASHGTIKGADWRDTSELQLWVPTENSAFEQKLMAPVRSRVDNSQVLIF